MEQGEGKACSASVERARLRLTFERVSCAGASTCVVRSATAFNTGEGSS